MRALIVILFFSLTSFSSFSQNEKVLKDLYAQGKIEECFEKAQELIYEQKQGNDSYVWFHVALCYYRFHFNPALSEEYPNALKKSVIALKKTKRKDKKNIVWTNEKKRIEYLQNIFLEEISRLLEEQRLVKANFFDKNLSLIFPKDERSTPSKTIEPVSTPVKKVEETVIEAGGSKSGRYDKRYEIIEYAKSKMGVPYRYGGTSDKGFDCSGFTQHVMWKNNVAIPRTSGMQANTGKKVKVSKVQKGDLLFFGKTGKIQHVGIVISNPGEPLTMIHASSSQGISIIKVMESSYWRPRLLYARNVVI